MASLAQLRKEAKGMGIAPSVIRGAETAEELQAEIENFSSRGAGTDGEVKPKVSKKVVAKKKVAKKAVAAKSTAKTTASKSGNKSKPAAKSTQGKVKRSTAAKPKARDNDSGRNLLDSVDYNQTDGWNARSGSAPDRIIKALKKFRGNRDKVYDHLEADVWDFVGKKMANGDRRSKQDALKMLAYRIARTEWDFAMRTGQHSKAENRAEYGTGGTGQGVWKPASARKAAPKTTGRKTTARKSGSKTKAAAGRKRSAAKR